MNGTVCGVVLAAGAGSRFGGPKALAREADGEPWIALVVDALRRGGCGEAVVVLGAGADAAEPLVPGGVHVVRAAEWEGGLSRSLVAGLAAVPDAADAVVLVPVDVPELAPRAVARVIEAAGAPRETALVRAVYAGAPGHPVLIGRAHWRELRAALSGDTGAGPYLARHGAIEVDCADLWSGNDRDHRG